MANIAYTEHYFQGSENDLKKLKEIFEFFDKNGSNRNLSNLAKELILISEVTLKNGIATKTMTIFS